MSGSASDGDPPTRVEAAGAQGVQVGDHGIQVNKFIETYIETQIIQPSFAPLAQPGSSAEVAGWPLDEVTDPFTLEVHRPVQPENLQAELPMLPVYVRREHDLELTRIVRVAARGSSGIAVLVGGSSTGKTRACWEALRLLRDQPEQWRLWHPIDPSRPEAALREMSAIGPRTVVWLNDAHFYLNIPDGGLGERVAAGLRELLRHPARAPVLVLATLWPEFWDVLTARPEGSADRHAQARELLVGRDITVPGAFTATQLRQLSHAGDVRLAQAAAAAQDGQVIQVLAGAPDLLARYRNAPPAAAALINTSMDARRLGMGVGLPHAFLEAAVPAYLTEAEWAALGTDWLEHALAYTAVPCKGVRGPLTRIRPRPARSRATGPGPRKGDEQPVGGQGYVTPGPLYRLADYLEQHGRHHRENQIPPTGFWAAAAGHASAADQAPLGDAAHPCGLYRDAAQLHKNAAGRGSLDSVLYLSIPRHYFSTDARPFRWAVTHAALGDPRAVANLIDSLRTGGAREQIRALADRAAAHVTVGDPDAVSILLDSLWRASAREQVIALADRAVAHVSLDDPVAMARLLESLRAADAQEQVTALLHREPAAHVSLGPPGSVAYLLDVLRRLDKPILQKKAAGAHHQLVALARRAAAHVSVDDPAAVAKLLDSLRAAGAQKQVNALADRAAANAPVDHPYAVADLLDGLRRTTAQDQLTILADRAVHVPLRDPGAVAKLLGSLQKAGAQEQVTTLLDRNPAARVSLDRPFAVADLLESLRMIGTQEQVATLLDRNPAAHVPLDDPYGVARLLRSLRKAEADGQVNKLAKRAAAHAPVDDPYGLAKLQGSLRAADMDEQATALADRAADVRFNNPAAIADMLDRLEVGRTPRRVTSPHRDATAARIPLDDPYNVAHLLNSLRRAGAEEHVATLLDRDPAAHVPVRDPFAVAVLLDSLRAAGADKQASALASRAVRVSIKPPTGLAVLIDSMRRAGAHRQVAALLNRSPAVRASLKDPLDRAFAQGMQRSADEDQQVTALLNRDPAGRVPLDDPYRVARLLDSLRRAGADGQVTVLLNRDPAGRVPLDDPYRVARLLESLRRAEADGQVATLLNRDPAVRVLLYIPSDVADLLDSLRSAGAEEQVTALVDRLPGAGMFELFLHQEDHQGRFRFGREADGTPAEPWGWQDLD